MLLLEIMDEHERRFFSVNKLEMLRMVFGYTCMYEYMKREGKMKDENLNTNKGGFEPY